MNRTSKKQCAVRDAAIWRAPAARGRVIRRDGEQGSERARGDVLGSAVRAFAPAAAEDRAAERFARPIPRPCDVFARMPEVAPAVRAGGADPFERALRLRALDEGIAALGRLRGINVAERTNKRQSYGDYKF